MQTLCSKNPALRGFSISLIRQNALRLTDARRGKHLVYYDPAYLKDNANQILHYLEHEEEREAIAAAGCKLVHAEHTLEKMLGKPLTVVHSEATA